MGECLEEDDKGLQEFFFWRYKGSMSTPAASKDQRPKEIEKICLEMHSVLDTCDLIAEAAKSVGVGRSKQNGQ